MSIFEPLLHFLGYPTHRHKEDDFPYEADSPERIFEIPMKKQSPFFSPPTFDHNRMKNRIHTEIQRHDLV